MEKCPHMRSKQDYDFCELTERLSGRIKPCLLMSGEHCEEWEEIQKEWANEVAGMEVKK